MGDKYILDENRKPVLCEDLMAWAKWVEESERTMKKTEKNGIKVSTMFLGLDHSFGDGPPMLYETVIFGGEHDQYQERYATEEEALKGHTKAEELAWETEDDS